MHLHLVQDNSDRSTNMFGPLLAMHAGHNHSVRLQNQLSQPTNDYLVFHACHCRPFLSDECMLDPPPRNALPIIISTISSTRHYSTR